MIYFLKVHAHVEIPQYLLRLNHCIVKGNCIYCFNFILYRYLDKLKRVAINVTVLGSTPTQGNELFKNEDVFNTKLCRRAEKTNLYVVVHTKRPTM